MFRFVSLFVSLLVFVIIVWKVLGLVEGDDKKRGPELRTRSLGIAKRLNILIRVNAYAISREHQLLLLDVPFLAILGNKN